MDIRSANVCPHTHKCFKRNIKISLTENFEFLQLTEENYVYCMGMFSLITVMKRIELCTLVITSRFLILHSVHSFISVCHHA